MIHGNPAKPKIPKQEEDRSFAGLIDQLTADHKEKIKDLELEYREKIKIARKRVTAGAQQQAIASRSDEQQLREKVAFLELQEKEMRKQICCSLKAMTS